MEILKLKLEKAISTYKNGDNDTKKLLIDLYGEEHFIADIKDRVTSYEAACKLLARTPLTLDQFLFMGEKAAKRQFARHKISVGIEAINEGWEADFDNESQYKYYNWFYNKKRAFSSGVSGCFTVASDGSDLCCETREKAETIAKAFRDDYIIYLF